MKNVKEKKNQIGKENVYNEEDVSSIIENMENIDYFDTHLVYKLDNRVVDNPYIVEKRIIEYFHKFFFYLKIHPLFMLKFIKINIILENIN